MADAKKSRKPIKSQMEANPDEYSLKTIAEKFNFFYVFFNLVKTCCNSNFEKEVAEDEMFVEIEFHDQTTLPEVLFPWQYIQYEDNAKKEGKKSCLDQFKFLINCTGYCVGLGNIWRFPTLAYVNGGGTFIVPYVVILMIVGIPLFLLEFSFGQFSGFGPSAVWSACPLFRGIGVAMMTVSYIIAIYFNVVSAWSFFYLFNSFTSPLPWKQTESWWNKNPYWKNFTGDIRFLQHFTGDTPSEEFWKFRVLQEDQSDGLSDPKGIVPELAICLSLSWLIVFLCISNKIRTSGKTLYLTTAFPYIILFILLTRGLALEGASTGIWFYFTPDWSRMGDLRMWAKAATQIFFSLDISRGGLLVFGSRNDFNNSELVKMVAVIIAINLVTSLFAGLVVFSILGHMAYRMEAPVDTVVGSDIGLMFIAYPSVVALLPYPSVWSAMFFTMLLSLALGSEMGLCTTVTNCIMDEFPGFFGGRRVLLSAMFCFSAFCFGMLLISKGGVYWFRLLDGYSSSFGFFCMSITMCLVFMWGYGFFFTYKWRFLKDFELMTGFQPNLYLRLSWSFTVPAILVVLLLFSIISYKPIDFGTKADTYYGNIAGIFVSFIPVYFMFGFGGIQIYDVYDERTGFYHAVRALTRPGPRWGPKDPDVPYQRTQPLDRKSRRRKEAKALAQAQQSEMQSEVLQSVTEVLSTTK